MPIRCCRVDRFAKFKNYNDGSVGSAPALLPSRRWFESRYAEWFFMLTMMSGNGWKNTVSRTSTPKIIFKKMFKIKYYNFNLSNFLFYGKYKVLVVCAQYSSWKSRGDVLVSCHSFCRITVSTWFFFFFVIFCWILFDFFCNFLVNYINQNLILHFSLISRYLVTLPGRLLWRWRTLTGERPASNPTLG